MKSPLPRYLHFVLLVAFGGGSLFSEVGAQTTFSPNVAQAIDAAFEDIDPSGPGCAVGGGGNQELA